MKRRLIALATVVGLVVAASAQAGHHLRDVTEVYSSAGGSVQFIELYTAVNDEQNLGLFNVKAGTNQVNFVTNLPTNLTADTYVLIATAGFGSLPGGVTPDYVLPFTNFVDTGGGTLNYANGTDVWSYGTVPTDGSLSLKRNGSTSVNDPENFAGNQGSVDLTSKLPAAGTWGMVLLVGALLLAASGLLRRRQGAVA